MKISSKEEKFIKEATKLAGTDYMPFGISYDKSRLRRVALYGRVSTEHEAQISALENQMQWYDDIVSKHDNWTVVGRYIDEGITGTQAKKRPSFMKMLNDARQKRFDLIVTREVCRFARNTVDTLVVTRELKNIGIEVYFVEDNIWTMDGDGELRLTIMATLAQEESRKTSERVRAGQKISRDKGVLYGSGNILGYDRDKTTGTYVINPEQAETVKMIYDLYESGMGMTQIRDEMIRRRRKDSSGLVRWENTKISRILHNSTYKGWQAYLKSQRNNFLDQKIIKNHDEETYMYVKGKYEPIISEEQWDRCKAIRLSRLRECTYFTADGEKRERKSGVFDSPDIWSSKLICRCGYKMRKNKWRKNKDGEKVFGYKCYNQLNNGSKKVREEAGISVKGACDLREICDWKLWLMARCIFSAIWTNRQDILRNISSIYKYDYHEEVKETDAKKEEIEKAIEKLDNRLKKLADMRMDDEISKDEFRKYKTEIEIQKGKLVQELTATKQKKEENVETPTDGVVKFLMGKMDFTVHRIDSDIIKKFVSRIIPQTETEFEWYLDFDLETNGSTEKKLLWDFTIGFAEAKAYKKEINGMLRQNQWEDLNVKVYV